MNDLRTLIKGWLDENAKEYYGISMENANAALWAFEDALDKMDEMQKAMQDIHDKLNNGASHEFEETIQYCITKAFYALKGNQ